MTLTTLQLSESFGEVTAQITGNGAPVVLIHGVGMQSAAWTPQIDFLAASHKVFALDLPGHGGSEALSSSALLPDFVAWLTAVLNTLDLGPVNLAGHSMGALVSAGLAISHPELISRVALLNGVYRRSDKARAAVIARADEISRGVFDLETPLTRWFGDSDGDEIARTQVSGWLSVMNHGGYATAYNAFARGDETYADHFCEIACPFVALTGDGDLNSSANMSLAMAAAVQNGKHVVIKGHRHMVNLTAPDQVNTALKNWLLTPTNGGQND